MNIKKYLLILLIIVSMQAHSAIVIGNPNGKIAITEIYDYQCPHCRAMAGVIDTLLDNNDQLMVRLLPVTIMNEKSVLEAAYAASRALYHNDFNESHRNFMFGNFSTMDSIHEFIERNNASRKVLKEMGTKKVKETINEGYQIMNNLHIHETPIFIIEPLSHSQQPIVLVGEHSYEELNGIISTLMREEQQHEKAS